MKQQAKGEPRRLATLLAEWWKLHKSCRASARYMSLFYFYSNFSDRTLELQVTSSTCRTGIFYRTAIGGLFSYITQIQDANRTAL